MNARPLSSFVAHIEAAMEKVRRRRAADRARKLAEALAAYETADPRFCVRRLEVVELAARALGGVVNNALHAEVTACARQLGWQPIRPFNRALFRCARRRDQNDRQALAVSRANRHDPRWPGSPVRSYSGSA